MRRSGADCGDLDFPRALKPDHSIRFHAVTSPTAPWSNPARRLAHYQEIESSNLSGATMKPQPRDHEYWMFTIPLTEGYVLKAIVTFIMLFPVVLALVVLGPVVNYWN